MLNYNNIDQCQYGYNSGMSLVPWWKCGDFESDPL